MKRRKHKRKMNPEGGGKSRYARKKEWLNAHPIQVPAGTDRDGNPKFEQRYPFGFQVAEPKPYR